MAKIVKRVKVSPHYPKNGWYDPKAKINFFKKDGVIDIEEGTSMVNINRHIRFNYLIELPLETEEEARKKVEPNQNQKGLSPNKLLNSGNDAVKGGSLDDNANESSEEATSKKLESEEVKKNDTSDDEILDDDAGKEDEVENDEETTDDEEIEDNEEVKDLMEKSYNELQAMAKDLDINAGGTTEALRDRVLKAIQDI